MVTIILKSFFIPLTRPLFIQRTQDEHASYENAMCELAESLQLSRNIVMAVLALESWKAFMERWLKSEILSFDVRDTAVISEKTCKAANEILKVPLSLPSYVIPLTFMSVI